MNCPKCARLMKVHPTLEALDVAFYFCDYCRKSFVESLLLGFGNVTEFDEKVIQKRRKEDWEPKIGDRVWVSGKTWSSAGTITGFAKDDPEVPWIKVDKDGTSWDARDAGSIRRLEDK